MSEQIKAHAKSAALTFAATLGVELYAATAHVDEWTALSWGPILSAITFTAARAALKVLLASKVSA